jgi:tetratricopeptide (TPR) repeat protein
MTYRNTPVTTRRTRRLTTLADFLERRERVDEATELRRRALAVFERTDVGTLMTANTHQALARTAEAAGELDLAEQHWRGAMNSTPASHLAMAQFSLGEFLFRQERWAESLAEVTAAGEFWRTRPHNRTDVARSAAVRAVNLMHLERWAEAVHSLDEVVEIQGEHGPDHADVRWASELLSICRDNLAQA